MVMRSKNGKAEKGITSCTGNPDYIIVLWLYDESRTDKNSWKAESQSLGVCIWGKPDGRVIWHDDAVHLILTSHTAVCLS